MANINYIVKGIRDYSLSDYIRLMKTEYEEFKVFKRNHGVHLAQDPNAEFIEESWDAVEPFNTAQAFMEQNLEKRRVIFSALGPAKIFAEIKPQLIDRQVIQLTNKTWTEDGEEVVKQIDDVYEFYKVKSQDLGLGNGMDLSVVRCWCTTTNREYWIFVEDSRWTGNGFKTALDAISWTFRVGVAKEDILEIYRQGDCLVVKARENTKVLPEHRWYHLDGETYKNKLIAQS